MIVNRLCPAGMPVAIRSVSACIISDAISFCSAVILMSTDAWCGKGTSAGWVQETGPKALSSGRDDTPPGSFWSDSAWVPNRRPGGASAGSGTSSRARSSQLRKASASMRLASS